MKCRELKIDRDSMISRHKINTKKPVESYGYFYLSQTHTELTVNHPERNVRQAEMDDSPREKMSGKRGYERELQYRGSQGKDLVSGSEDKRENGCKNGREENGQCILFVCFC